MKEKYSIYTLIRCLKSLNLLPRTGNGRIEFIIQDNVLIDSVDSNRTRIKIKFDDVRFPEEEKKD